MIPLIVGYVAGQGVTGRRRSFLISSLFAIGLALTFVGLGIVAALVGGLIGAGTQFWYYLVAAVCILFGLQMMGALSIPVPEFGIRMRERVARRNLMGALLLGLVSGLVASQCATPALAAILSLVMAKGAVAYGATLLFVYALGRGVPIVLFGTFSGWLAAATWLQASSQWLERVAGALIVGVGLYFLWIA